MAIHNQDDIPLASELRLEVDQITYRLKVWIWLVMTFESGQGTSFASYVKSPLDSIAMADYFRTYPQYKGRISPVFHETLLPDEALAWIDDDKRQSQWVLGWLHQLGYFNNFNINLIQTVLTGRDLIVGLIDLRRVLLTEKKEWVKEIQFNWNEYLKMDRIFGWFMKQDEPERCNLMWEVLSKNDSARLRGLPRFGDLQEMLLFFDASGYSYEAKQLWIDRVKRRWSQNQYRQNLDDKKQINLVMASKAIHQLDKLADEFELSRVQILETLILDEAKKKTYLSERLRRLAALTSTENAL